MTFPRALSIRQPWAHSIVFGGKDIENRNWPTRYRGPILIHAAKAMTRAEFTAWRESVEALRLDGQWSREIAGNVRFGGIIGAADLVDCVEQSRSPWFAGRYGFVLRHARPLAFIPCKGALGLFDPPADVRRALAGKW